ncbi:Uncharacterized protein BANIM336_00546 [Bifidobacterium animalis subsp. animalis IM386]|uniref:Uncharacterized protein n=1 Tax=Bifidobacterium animalis subsp. animalis IM386 TaxID=1402194 RepID=A0AAV2W3P8_9BIFI|nr:hypothetical protein [Bifidobacterium animalis]AFI62416.1 hypothetical protein BANAN_00955 [Bifidobacterium animalis subsp. animalis ATCC 25527]AYN23053.1 hypothetical protein CNCMI4602_0188 [Bifidobacterium animalis subsp. animalis]KFI41548.1 hypothetical protein BASA_0044 [Bifidobacterium animalis subsp. animalis]CDI67237.1 Uncharacterized protein BANIM336_00546 [Bifidobacterium animalis subsp. animalis IM386]
MNNNTMTKFEQQTANALRLIGTNLGCLTTAVSRLEPKEPGNDNNMARIADALEQLVEVAEACRLNHVESLTCGELMEGVTFSTEAQHEDVGDGETLHSFVRLALDDMGLGFDVRAINDEHAECYGDATGEWSFQSPDELHALADAFRTRYAAAIDMVASEWAKRIADGTIPAREAVA